MKTQQPTLEGRKEKLGRKLKCERCKRPVWFTANGICTNCRRDVANQQRRR